MNPCLTNDPFCIPTNLEEDSAKLLEANVYTLAQGTDTIAMSDALQHAKIEGMDVPNMEKEDPTVQDDNKVEDLAVRQPASGDSVQEEKTLDRDTISDLEKKKNPEWFVDGKVARTPQRYLTMRNFILDFWNDHKPNYVNKSVIRKNMKNCGDVNAFGRVHSFLEAEGYINVNCTTPLNRPITRKPRPPRPANYEYRPKSPSQTSLDKKRKKNRNLEMWNSSDIPPSKSKRRRDKPRYADNGAADLDSDPYQLVPLEDYNEDYPAPFKVQVNSDALAIADFHSHLVLTEIIGLLGGTFETDDNGQRILAVKKVFPCKSTSTDIQCEMDPASEMEARELFTEMGLQVVGWYHSHPTFVAVPSIRDIETQMSYQDLFRIKETGVEPFIGLIINPYNNKDGVSAMTYVHISDKVDTTMTFRLPYKCDLTVIPNNIDMADTMAAFEQLVEEYKDHQEKVDMSSRVDGDIGTDVCLNSLGRFVHLGADLHDTFMDQVRGLITNKFLVLHKD